MTEQSNSKSWIESSEGVWERPLGENERFIRLVGDSGLSLGRENWAISSQAVFNTTDSPEFHLEKLEMLLREAWKHYRFAQPSIATYLVDEKLIYEVPNDTTLESWLNDTFFIASMGTSANDIIATRRPNHFATLTYVPHELRIVLQTPHWRTDGIGIFLMLDVYFTLLAKCIADTIERPDWGSEIQRLSVAVEDIAGLSHEQTPETTAIAEQCMATFGLVGNNTGLEYYGDASTMPAGTRVKWIKLEALESSQIFAAAKARDLSVTSVVHASIVEANFHFARADRNNQPHVSTIRFGLRPYLPKKYTGPEHGATCLTSGYMYKADRDTPWAENARAITDEYRKGYARIMPAHRQYAKMLVDVMSNMPPPDPDNLPSDMDVSSAGIVDKFVKSAYEAGGKVRLDVMSVSFGVDLITRQMVCFVWTFRGRLNLQIAYNEAYHTEEGVEEILQYIKDRTKEELGVV